MMQNDQKSSTPDTWYSWIIAIAGNAMFALIYGVIRVSGALFTEIVATYNIDRRLASVPFMLSSTVKSFLGPVAGWLIHVLGFRPVFLLGSIFAFIGILGCSFADNIVTICVCWGLLYGTGLALTICSIPQIIYLYFEKHVSSATGFVVTGAAIGGFILSPITEIILKEYGLSGTFLILSGIVLHTVPVSMLLKEPKVKPLDLSLFCLERKIEQEGKINEKDKCPPSSNDVHSPKGCVNLRTKSSSQTHSNEGECEVEGESNVAEVRNISYPKENFKEVTEFESSKRTLTTRFEVFKILWHPVFLQTAFTRCLNMLSFLIITILMIDFWKDKGFSSSTSSYILMFLYGSDLFGKVAFGWVTDKGYMTMAGYASLCYFFAAASFSAIVWPSTFIPTVIAAIFLGTCLGVTSVPSHRLISQYIEEDKQIMAMTSGDILVGPSGFLVTMLIGYFRDNLGTYDWFMYMMSIVFFANSVMLLFLPKLVKWTASKKTLST